MKTRACPECDGEGGYHQELWAGFYALEPKTRYHECKRCHGSGEVEDDDE